ncbi:hypothetical protein J4211_02520 [Candidatus Woesearchaeota archaeon]|nr:hypothetical protein [Candidatus Woesearchaeota archaeon]
MEDSMSYLAGFEVIDTRSIVLEEISKPEFRRREKLWEDNRFVDTWDVCSRIANPVVETDGYAHLLYVLGKTPNARRICVREEDCWRKFFPHELELDVCESLAETLQNDKFKRNFLDVVFGVSPNWTDWAIMEFGELAGEIIGYKLRVPIASSNQFSMNARGFNYNFGIWVPELFAGQHP